MRRSLLGNLVCCLVVALVFILPISVFAQENYTIRYFNMCSDTDAISTVDVTAGNNLALPTEAGENVGFSLFGWYEKDAPTTFFEKGQEITLGENEYDTYDLCALWGRNITYHLNGGENNPNNPTVVYDGRTYNLEDPTKVGYTFQGWYSDEGFVNRITEIRGSNTELTDVYAKFEANKYYVAFNSNGGNGSMDEVICEYDTDCELPQNIIQRAGYTWIKWNTKQDGTGTSYNDKAKVRNLTSINTDIVYLHAQYSIIEYTITYNLNGGVNNSGNPSKYTVETSAFDLKTPTRDGYVFDGWYSDSGFTMHALSVTKGTTGNKSFYAKWRAIDYTVTYNLNGGVNNENNPGGYNIEQYVELTNPTRKGYVFGGWYTDSNFTNKVTSIPSGSKGNKTYYAQWVKSSYKINFNANGGKDKMNATTCKANTNCTLRGNSFKKTGYVFVEWNTKKDGTGLSFSNKQVVQNITSNSSITLYARWRPIVYKIAFSANGGTGSMETIECTYNKNCVLTANVFTRIGFNWTGWNTKANGKGKNYKNSQTVKNLASTAKTVTLYSKWSKIKYSIKYNLNGGNNNKKNPKTYYVTTATINLKNPTRKGYGFLGWYTDSEFTNKITSIPKGSTGTKTLYAKWIKTDYKVVFKANGGSGKMKTITCKINKNCTLTKNSYSRKGYSFAGWNTKQDGTGISYSNKGTIIIDVANDTTLYAMWKPNNYSIKYNLNGGVNNSGNPSTYSFIETVTLKNPTKNGYNFAGWYGDSKFKKRITTINKGSTGTKTVYARWIKGSLAANRNSITVYKNGATSAPGDVIITYLKDGSIYFDIENDNVVTGRFGSWYGDDIVLYLYAENAGSTKVRITNSLDSSTLVLDVRVVETNEYQDFGNKVFSKTTSTRNKNKWSANDVSNATDYLSEALSYLSNASTAITENAFPESSSSQSYLSSARTNIYVALVYLDYAKNIIVNRMDVVSKDGYRLLDLIQQTIDTFDGYDEIDLSNFVTAFPRLAVMSVNGGIRCLDTQSLMLSYFEYYLKHM